MSKKIKIVGQVLLKLTERDKENLEYVSELVNPSVSASAALRSGLEMFCHSVGRAKPTVSVPVRDPEERWVEPIDE